MDLVYLIFDKYIQKDKKELIVYLAISLILLSEQVFSS